MGRRIPTRIPRYAFLVGMKCGSTSLYRSLADHPQVAPSRPKEPHFFSTEGRWAHGMGWYERRFRWRPGHRLALDASPSYGRVQQFPAAPRRIARLDADKRVLFIARDPIARIRSHARHAMMAPWGRHIVEADRLARPLLDASDYATQLDAYVDAVGRDHMHVVTLGRLRRRPREVVAEICRFLDIEPMPLPVERHNAAAPKSWRIRSAWQRAYERAGGPRRRRILRTAAYHGRRIPAVRRVLMRPARRVPLPAGWEEQARRELAPSMQRLQRQWGIDVKRWGF